MRKFKFYKPFVAENLGLEANFSLTSYTDLKGWGCKVPQNKLLKYLEMVGLGDIGKETPDCSVIPIEKNLKLISTLDFFYPLVDDPYL